ncbi:MAG: nucleotidyltransferase domain-containing protein [Oligoflexia bacterium]|nr:nucleotidyltransferase domain-containing protein [Oligoflexia bacterium]
MVLAALTAELISPEILQLLINKLLTAILERTSSQTGPSQTGPMEKNVLSQVILFGSAARNQATIYSDIDLLIVVNSVSDVRPTMRKFAGLSGELNWALDLIVVDREQFERKREIGGVFFDAWNQGIVLFEKEGKGKGKGSKIDDTKTREIV